MWKTNTTHEPKENMYSDAAESCCGNAFSTAGSEKLVGVDGKMDGGKYRTILEENLKKI